MSLILPFVPCHKWDPAVSPFFLLLCAPLCASLLVPPESGLSSFSLPGRLTPLPIWTPVASLAPCTGTRVIYEGYNLGEVTGWGQSWREGGAGRARTSLPTRGRSRAGLAVTVLRQRPQ